MKYVMLEGKNAAGEVQKVPIIFPNFMVHKFTADVIKMVLVRWHDFEDLKVVSAGEILLDVNATVGHSETCKVTADPNDRTVIDTYNYLHGMQ